MSKYEHSGEEKSFRDYLEYLSKSFELIKKIAEYDKGTEEHCCRVAWYAYYLCINNNCEEIFTQKVTNDALIHDIGKIKVDHKIITKPDKLTKEEFAIAKTHSREGYNIILELNPSNPYLVEAANNILAHHENFDGRGYPDGLKGQNIPFEARILKIADVYDALTSKRPYKEAKNPMDALNIMATDMKGHFDRVLLASFAQMIEDNKKIIAKMININEELAKNPDELTLRLMLPPGLVA